MVKIRKYFTFEDFIKNLQFEGQSSTFNQFYTYDLVTGTVLAMALQIYAFDYRLMSMYYQTQPTKALFGPVLQELTLRYYKSATTWRDYDPTCESEPENPYYTKKNSSTSVLYPLKVVEMSEETRKMLTSIYEIYNETKDRYETLLGYYASEKANLLNKIKSKSVARYNDTPQDGGDWSDDEHTSNITQNESETDMLPLMDRLTSIQNNFRNLVKEWADEFKGLFIPIPEDEVDE